MPFTVKMPARKIILNEDNKYIIQIYNNAIAAQKQRLSTVPEGPTLRPGLWNAIKNSIEKRTSWNLNARQDRLPGLQKELDPPAKFLRDKYIIRLNNLAKKEGVESSDIVEGDIKNRYVLIRELILRLLTEALSVDAPLSKDILNELISMVDKKPSTEPRVNKEKERKNDDESQSKFDEGSSSIKESQFLDAMFSKEQINIINSYTETYKSLYIKILQGFLDGLRESKKLVNHSILGDALSSFGVYFDSQAHTGWIKCFCKITNATAMIHANKTCINEALDCLEEVRLRVISHLIAEFVRDSSIAKARFTAEMLDSTLLKYEEEWLEKNKKGNIYYPSREWEIISYFDDKTRSFLDDKVSQRERVRLLYDFLEKTNVLLMITAQFDLLNTTTGWVSIITGAIKMSELAKMMGSFGEEAAALLSISDEKLEAIKSTPIIIGLHIAVKLDTGRLRPKFQESIEKLNILDDDNLKGTLLEYIDGIFSKLDELSKKWNEKWSKNEKVQLVDSELKKRKTSKVMEHPKSVNVESSERELAVSEKDLPDGEYKLQDNGNINVFFLDRKLAERYSEYIQKNFDIFDIRKDKKHTKSVHKLARSTYYVTLTEAEYNKLKGSTNAYEKLKASHKREGKQKAHDVLHSNSSKGYNPSLFARPRDSMGSDDDDDERTSSVRKELLQAIQELDSKPGNP